MPTRLALIGDVTWCGTAVTGRSAELLALLAAAPGAQSSDSALVAGLWGEAPPTNPAKALQVVVARARVATVPEAIARTAGGYRLDLPRIDVDVLHLADLVAQSRSALTNGDLTRAVACAREATQLGAAPGGVGSEPDSPRRGAAVPMPALRAAAGRLAAQARELLGVGLSRTGAHADAVELLTEAAATHPHDEEVLEALLRSEAATLGHGAALERFARYRGRLIDSLGTEPGPALQRLHSELLAADRPVREGLRFEATDLLGRDDDLRRLRTLIGESRVTSIVGAGGLGKTRIAHVLGREATQPAVHFVELVGVGAPEDVIGEVGSALGVRDSVSGRRTLTPGQRSDVRARIAQQLDAAPTLLILDNCEHVVDAVADLVAFLVVNARELRVVTTSRAPLNIAAERVYALDQLAIPDAEDLFRRRAVAARPRVTLDGEVVREIVERLDGLPLAIELAAAKVRVMSVADVSARLTNRFELLRGGDRSAPDRHQTLLAVIDWSWNLLTEEQRRALRRLSVFQDGFTLAAAEFVLGPDAVDAVSGLVDQSLLTVQDFEHSVRYRMLETVREFGRMQLTGAGEHRSATRAQRDWAVDLAEHAHRSLFSTRQVEAVAAIGAEEGNLAEVLRQAVTEPDPPSVLVLMSVLCGYWQIRGDHTRVIALVGAVHEAMAGYVVPPELLDHARETYAAMVVHLLFFGGSGRDAARAALAEIGSDSADPRIAAQSRIALMSAMSDEQGEGLQELLRLGDGPDRHLAGLALMWAGHGLENNGQVAAAIEVSERALRLCRPEDGIAWATALRTQLASMYLQIGRVDEAEEHARAAVGPLRELGAVDDEIAVHAHLAMCALQRGHVDRAEELMNATLELAGTTRLVFGISAVLGTGQADIALARGDVPTALALYRRALQGMRGVRFPGLDGLVGYEPWSLFGESVAVVAHALHSDDGLDLYRVLRDKALPLLRGEAGYLDYPVTGTVLFALGLFAARRGLGSPEHSARLLLLGHGFSYSRSTPLMTWESAETVLAELPADLVDRVRADYAERTGPQLREDATAVVAQL
ncbi:ATP-binding protein [Occultella gossypii]|uniref:AAA family ATPase n=1 Tax=Occultella gossypii TaxID=2800820 RepID=A0ABS7SB37_9MICO|nr:BTAD domain-containing putative transcriptional regulator [Occultella gossypii]MBZ2197579.1 AAA family ATPase [Occultella gossypii]